MADSLLERNGTLFQILATVVVAVIGGIVGIWLRRRSKPSKTLDYSILDDVPIVSSQGRPKDLEVTYMGARVSDPRVTQVLIKNTGTEVIEDTDVLETLTLSRGTAKILDHNVIQNRNLVSGLEGITSADGTVEVHPKTLNANDEFVLQLIYDGGDNLPLTLSCRIRGQTRPPKIIRTPTVGRYENALEIAPILAAVILAPAWVYATIAGQDISRFPVWAGVGLLGWYTGNKIGHWLVRNEITEAN